MVEPKVLVDDTTIGARMFANDSRTDVLAEQQLAKALCSELQQLAQLHQEEMERCLDAYLKDMQTRAAGSGPVAAVAASEGIGVLGAVPSDGHSTTLSTEFGSRPLRVGSKQSSQHGQNSRAWPGPSGCPNPTLMVATRSITPKQGVVPVELPGFVSTSASTADGPISGISEASGRTDSWSKGEIQQSQRTSQPMTPRSSHTSTKHRRKKPGGARADDRLFRKTREKALAQQTIWQHIAYSVAFEWVSGALIFANCIFLGWQSQLAALQAEEDTLEGRDPATGRSPAVISVEVAFCVVFSIELFIRWRADGLLGFFTSQAYHWNLFDSSIVGLSWLEIILEAMALAQRVPNMSVLRILRVVRIIRVMRVIRLLHFFRELRMMILSIINSVKSLVWVFLVLGLVFFIFGINFTEGTVQHLDTHESRMDPKNAELIRHFGSLDKSIMSLYMAMSGGRDWGVYYETLKELPLQYQASWIIYITFAIFAVVNIVTGVFVESALAANHKDRENVIREELDYKKSYLETLGSIFEELDNDNTGCISCKEFENSLREERVMAYFRALKLDVSDAQALFRLLDYDQSDEISIDEFLDGCYRLQGESSALDVKMMQYEVKFLKESVLNNTHMLRELQRTLKQPQMQDVSGARVFEHPAHHV